MQKTIDIHSYDERLASALARLKKTDDISDENKAAIIRFHNDCLAEGLTTGRVAKYIYLLSKISRWLKKDFEKATKEDILRLVQMVERDKDYADWTKRDFKIGLKKFYKWLRKSEDIYPDEVRWIKTNMKNGRNKLPEELITEEEIKAMVDSADHIRDKALLFMLYESGCRIGEVASLRIRHIQFDKYGATAIVTGKTGDRRIRLIASAPLLSTWLANHPWKNQPDAPLWVGIGARSKNEAVSYSTLCMMIKSVAAKAGVKKKVHPHLFRHSRATYLAKFLTEAQMKQIFGWTQSSDMAAVYVHLSGRDTDDAILELNGIKTDSSEKKESTLKPMKCPRCDTINPATARFCQRCSFALDVVAAMRIDDERNLADDLMARLMADKATQSFLARKIEKLGLERHLSKG